MSYERDEAMRLQAATEDMIRMRDPRLAISRKPTIGADWEKWYRALRAADPTIYQATIQGVEAVTLTHRVPTKAAAEYERNAVMLACQCLGVKP